MSDNLTPRERAEKALEAAGFEKRHGEWRRHSELKGGDDSAEFSYSLMGGPDLFTLNLTDAAEHLPAYLNAKALLEACQLTLDYYIVPSPEFRKKHGHNMTEVSLLAMLRSILAKAEGKV